jgi:hypothetical protein
MKSPIPSQETLAVVAYFAFQQGLFGTTNEAFEKAITQGPVAHIQPLGSNRAKISAINLLHNAMIMTDKQNLLCKAHLSVAFDIWFQEQTDSVDLTRFIQEACPSRSPVPNLQVHMT